MKPLHLAVAAAVIVVAALVGFLMASGGERAAPRRAGGQEHTGPGRGGAAAVEDPDPAAKGVHAGAGALAITLRIVDDGGGPAAGADVEVDRGFDPLRTAADGDGVLHVRGLAAGIYDLRARHGRLSGALRFELRRTTDLGTLRLSASVTVRGRVHGPRGEPLPGARVEACRAADRAGFDVMAAVRTMGQPEEVVATARTDDDGAYELALPQGGTFSLRATAAGFAQEGEPARLYAADTDGVDFWLLPGALLEGHVVDARQSPIAGARVLLVDPMGILGRRVPKAEAATGADGAFSLVASPAQQSMLVVRAAGYASHMQPNLRLPQTNLVIVLEEGVSLTFLAVDAERPEIPAPHVSVVASYRGGFGAGETDEQGRLLIENLPTRGTGMGGQQQLFLWGGGYIPQSVELGRSEPVDGVVDLGVIKVAPGGVVRGRVLDKTTGDPVAGAAVRTFGGLDPQVQFFGGGSAVSAPDGSFLLTGVPLEANLLLATHPDFVGDVDPMTLFGGMRGGSGGPPIFPEGSREIERNVELLPASSVEGVVFGPDGSPVAGAEVAEVASEGMMLMRLLGSGPATATTDAEGRFVLKGLPPGREVRVAATHRDYGASEEKRFRPGDREIVTLQLAEPLAVQGLVVDEAGAPVAGVRVQARRGAARSPRTPLDADGARPSVTDEQGRYLLRNVPAGEMTINFDHPDYAPVTTPVALSGSRDLGRTVLPRGASIAGTAVDEAGQPIAGIVVYAQHDAPAPGMAGRASATAVTDEEGRFSMRGLGDGSYRLRTWDRSWHSPEPSVRAGTTDARLVLRKAGRLLGRVTGRGVPVAGASVRARRVNSFLGWTRSGPDGTFVLEALPPDEPFDVIISHDGYRELTVEAVRASADRTQDFVLQPGAEVSGQVVDGAGRGVAGAQVQVRVDGKIARTVETDATGAFTAGGLDPGAVSLRLLESEQGFVTTDWIDVAQGARGVRIVATAGESIRGVVRDPEGKPLRQVSLQAIDAEGRTAAQTWVWQEDGAFELRGLKPGTYTVRAQRYVPTADGEGRQPMPIEVPGVAAGSSNVEVRFR